MGWMDDLQVRAEQAVQSVQTDVTTYFSTRAKEELVKVVAPPTGNLSAEEIAAGQRGGPSGLTAPSGAPASNAVSAGQVGASMMSSASQYLPWLAIAGLAYVIFARKSRG